MNNFLSHIYTHSKSDWFIEIRHTTSCMPVMCDLIIAYIDATLVGAANWVTTNRKRFHLLWKQFAMCLLHKIHFWSNSQKFSPVKETRYMAPSHSTLIVVSRWLALALILSRFSSQPTNYGQAYWSRNSLGVLSQNDHYRGVISWDHGHLVTHHGWLTSWLTLKMSVFGTGWAQAK